MIVIRSYVIQSRHKRIIAKYQTDKFWDKIYCYAKDVAELHGIEAEQKKKEDLMYDLQIDALTVETTLANQTLKERILTDIVYKCCFLALISLNCASLALMKVLRTALTIAVNTV